MNTFSDKPTIIEDANTAEPVEDSATPTKKKSFKQRLIDKTHSKNGLAFLYFITFIESAFFPIPPDFLVVPMIVAKPESWKKIGFWVSTFSILGSFLGYFIGFALFASVGEVILETYGLQEKMISLGELYNDNAFWTLLVAAFTPLPYKVFTIAAGVFSVNIWIFALASFIGRGARYWLVSYLAHIGGSRAFWNYLKKLKKVTWIGLGLAVLAGAIIWFVSARG